MRASLLWVMLCILCLASAKLARDPRRLQQMVVTHELFGSIEELAERRGLKLGKRKFFTQTSEKFQDTSSPISTSEFQSSAQPLQTSSTTPLADLQNHSKTHVEKETTISLNEAPNSTQPLQTSQITSETQFNETTSSLVESKNTLGSGDQTSFSETSDNAQTTSQSIIYAQNIISDNSDNSDAQTESSSILLNNPIDISTTDSSQKQTSHSSQQSTASTPNLSHSTSLSPTTQSPVDSNHIHSNLHSKMSRQKNIVRFKCNRGVYCEMKLTQENSNIPFTMQTFMINRSGDFVSHTGPNSLTGIPLYSGHFDFEIQHRKIKKRIEVDVEDYPSYNHKVTIVLCYPPYEPMVTMANTRTVFVRNLSVALDIPIENITILSIKKTFQNKTSIEFFNNGLNNIHCDYQNIKLMEDKLEKENEFANTFGLEFDLFLGFMNLTGNCTRQYSTAPLVAKWTSNEPALVVLLGLITFLVFNLIMFFVNLIKEIRTNRNNRRAGAKEDQHELEELQTRQQMESTLVH